MTIAASPHAAPSERTGRVLILGSTGSIGCNTIDVIDHLAKNGGPHFELVGLAVGSNTERLTSQVQGRAIEAVAVADDKSVFKCDGVAAVFQGPRAATELVEAIAKPGDLVVGAMVGAAGVEPTLAALARGCDVALANKEALVAAGALTVQAARTSGAQIIPIDSEHSAIYQCLLSGRTRDEVERIVLTASGGPFRSWPIERIANATVDDALAHPTWSMGPKVTVDSASMMNKALELIEAHWLFGLNTSQLDAIVHPQSIVHSFVEFIDGSVIGQLSPPDMRLPIQYALTWPARRTASAQRVDWASFGDLCFEPVDHERFPALRTALAVIEDGPAAGVIFNAANEIAVQAFLEHRLPFGAIVHTVRATLEHAPRPSLRTLDDVLALDAEVRCLALEHIARLETHA